MIERLIDLLLPDNEIGNVVKPTKPGLPFLLKIAWIIEVYYFILNWCTLQIHWLIKSSEVIPMHAQIINNMVLAQFATYYKMLIFLGIGLLLCGSIMYLYRHFPGIEYNPWMIVYSRSGIILCPWFLAFGITYWVYSISPNTFIIVAIVIPLIVEVLRKIAKSYGGSYKEFM